MEMSVNSFGLEFRGPRDRKSSKQDNMAGHTLANKVVLDCESLSVRPKGKQKKKNPCCAQFVPVRPGNESRRSAEKQTRPSRRLLVKKKEGKLHTKADLRPRSRRKKPSLGSSFPGSLTTTQTTTTSVSHSAYFKVQAKLEIQSILLCR